MRREGLCKGKEIILSGFSATQITESLEILPLERYPPAPTTLPHFASTDPKKCRLSGGPAHALLLFAVAPRGLAAAGVVVGAGSPRLCPVGIAIHLMFRACVTAR